MHNAMKTSRRIPGRAGAARHPATLPRGTDWLMLVRTRCIDPAREDQFNDWYNYIDIPDVLEVPGYLRARRGLLQQDCDGDAPDGGNYLALYDIRSAAIDKTIIEMLMATRRMEHRGRSTDLLQVTERIYYRRIAPSHAAPGAPLSAEPLYFFCERFDCRPKRVPASLTDWYSSSHRRVVDRTPGMIRATRYELYRVLMLEPKAVPRFLTIYEISAPSSEQACALLSEVLHGWAGSAGRSNAYLAGDRSLFLKIREQVRA